MTQPRWGRQSVFTCTVPRVAEIPQPWTMLQSPFGARRFGKRKNTDAIAFTASLEFLGQAVPKNVPEMPWGQNLLILSNLTESAARLTPTAFRMIAQGCGITPPLVDMGSNQPPTPKGLHYIRKVCAMKGKLPTAKQLSDVVRAALPEKTGAANK